MTTPRDRFWADDASRGRLILVSRNPVAEAVEAVAQIAGRKVVLLEDDEGGAAVRAFADVGVTPRDAVVLCDHDAPDAAQVLRDALASEAQYVAMMASRGRASSILEELAGEGLPLDRLHMPAGLDVGGKMPGEIALSVVAEVVAVDHGRPGGPMRDRT